MTIEQVQNDPLCKNYFTLTDNSQTKVTKMKDKAKELYDLIKEIKPCRETSLALTKLEECSMWATKGIVQLEKSERTDIELREKY
jgi:hypothetical protein